ncbi:MAG: rhamnogalacturonan acetylesterase, partial [Acidobacteria bacterium]|nr:rhamnogalacturonan acetylesterase [Acidobacteriota bacterium]
RVIQGAPFKVVLTGDSTVALEGGWGPGFCATLTSNVNCVDLAQNGRSTKSYIVEGWWKKALDEKGSYYFVQFGHNDQKDDPKRHADPDGLYSENLRRFIQDVRSIGGIPIIVSSLSRRNYKDGKLVKDGLEEYSTAARRVAAEEKVTFVDLFSLSQHFLSAKTQEEADAFNATTHPDANAENGSAVKPDRTHLNDKGKAVFGRMVADNVIRTQVELGPNVNGLPEGVTPVLQQAAPTDGH